MFFPRYKEFGEPAAVWEHPADVLAITVKQHHLQDRSNWKMGESFFYKKHSKAKCVRDLMYPGSAWEYSTTEDTNEVSITSKKGKSKAKSKIMVKRDSALKCYSEKTATTGRYDLSTVMSRAFVLFNEATSRPTWEFSAQVWFKAIGWLHKDLHMDITVI
ncbi:hypothetical protein BDU57DRAFT_514951, partial [Ampelomyces quisqualis]